MEKQRILTGMRPSGRLHLGHYVGALEMWKRYAQDPTYDCIFLIADYQALGDNAKNVALIRDSVVQVTIDWLAVGLDPQQTPFVVQSYVPEHAELTMLLSMITPQSWLDRNPTVKAESERLSADDRTVGFMSYPMSQVADILLPKATVVPAGEDQAAHVEFTRSVAKRFNRIYGDTFWIPRHELSQTPRLVGTDGKNKMGKSTNNAIFLSDTPQEVAKKVRSMKTDPNRVHADTEGTLEDNVPFTYLDAFDQDLEGLADLKTRYKAGKVRDVEVKDRLTRILNDLLDPIREARARVEQNLDTVHDILQEGSRRERKIAQATMEEVRTAMRIDNYGQMS